MAKAKIREKKLKRALELFAEEMEDRLAQKEQEGFRGWDDLCDVDTKHLIASAHQKLAKVWLHPKSGLADPDRVDIANLMMMVWYRFERFKDCAN